MASHLQFNEPAGTITSIISLSEQLGQSRSRSTGSQSGLRSLREQDSQRSSYP
ncbi:hypothetical protein CJF31_00002992 [Rutstroemia sp. NJR-2017a BVV2]|nr:hypothetical protein CJF31_00001784 [Rutstroemia sp. NJR-2017a BVV2]PQE18346.1 hypothetical protein CJF31_00002992 [Rutstroemia sp. NJR-2017a BVV2]